VKCRKALCEAAGISVDDKKPVFGIITRLVEQKGIDLIISVMRDIVNMKAGLVLLGVGDIKYQKKLESLAKKHKGQISVRIAFDNKLAHMIEAGSDMFLMPSRYEPCGLNQIYSLRYGTIPVVRATGGLDDTIVDYDEDSKNGNGFKFKRTDAGDFLDAIERAVAVFEDKKQWGALMKRAMACDYSWQRSAKEYLALYDRLRNQTR